MYPKKIIVVSPACYPGTKGDAANYLEMIKGFMRRGIKIVLVCPKSQNSSSFDKEMREHGTMVVRIRVSPPRQEELGERQFVFTSVMQLVLFYIVALFTTLAVVLIENDAKHIIIRHNVLTINFPPLMGILRRTRGISSFADGDLLSSFASIGGLNAPEPILKILSFYERTVIGLYTRFLALTPSQIDRIARVGFPKSRVILKGVGIDTEKIPIYNLKNIPKNTFAYFGTLEKWGNVHHLLRAWAMVMEKKPEAKLYIIGNGSTKNALRKLANDLKIMESTVFLDGVPREVLWLKYFKLFRVAVVPRSWKVYPENASVKTIEALATGKPVIASKVPGIAALVNEEDGVVFAEPDNEESLALAINRLIDNDKTIYELSEQALKASRRFNVDSQLEELVRIMAGL